MIVIWRQERETTNNERERTHAILPPKQPKTVSNHFMSLNRDYRLKNKWEICDKANTYYYETKIGKKRTIKNP